MRALELPLLTRPGPPAGSHPQAPAWARSLWFSAAAWAVSRLAFLAIGLCSLRLGGQPIDWTGMWVHWDASYYLSIAGGGYHLPEAITGLETGQSNINFFPLLPLLIAAVHTIVPSLEASGLIAANLSLIAAAILLHRLASWRMGGQAGDWSVLSLMLLPGSFALSSPMSEAPFLALSTAAALLAATRPRAAAFASAWLTIARWTGILQGIGMALDWLIRRVRGQATYRQLLPICLIPLPLTLFLLFMFHLTGDGFAPLHSNFTFWHQRFGVPFQSLFRFGAEDAPKFQLQSGISLALILITLSQARRFSAGELLFILLSVASYSSSVAASESVVRYTIGLYPVHLAMGRLCARHPAARLLLLAFACIGAGLAYLWFRNSDFYV